MKRALRNCDLTNLRLSEDYLSTSGRRKSKNLMDTWRFAVNPMERGSLQANHSIIPKTWIGNTSVDSYWWRAYDSWARPLWQVVQMDQSFLAVRSRRFWWWILPPLSKPSKSKSNAKMALRRQYIIGKGKVAFALSFTKTKTSKTQSTTKTSKNSSMHQE